MKIWGRNKLLLMHFIRLPDDHVVDLNQNYDDQNLDQWTLKVETVQDFLIKLGIKPVMHPLEISTFSLNNVIVKLIKIMKRADKNWAHFWEASSARSQI